MARLRHYHSISINPMKKPVASVFVVLLCRDLSTTESRVKVLFVCFDSLRPINNLSVKQ